jgi:hypothetical protein
MFKKILMGMVMLSLTACAGFQRGCTAWQAENYASNWIVTQNDMNMKPVHCWKLPDTSISNETSSDGIYWLDPHHHQLVHISGWYNRVQVSNGDWLTAADSVGIDLAKCKDGIYN